MSQNKRYFWEFKGNVAVYDTQGLNLLLKWTMFLHWALVNLALMYGHIPLKLRLKAGTLIINTNSFKKKDVVFQCPEKCNNPLHKYNMAIMCSSSQPLMSSG